MHQPRSPTPMGWRRPFGCSEKPGTVVAFVGDGSLTGGMAWEALNNIAASDDLPLVIVVNDNGRSYTPTVGGLARHLTGLRTNPRYEQILELVKRNVSRAPLVGNAAYDILHGIKIGLKDVLAPQGLFSDLGLKYVGPIDGHDIAEVERALRQAKQFRGPVLVHCITRKGNGFKAAENHEEDRFHAVGKINSTTGEAVGGASGQTWTDLFSEELLRLGSHRRTRRRHYGSDGVSDGAASVCTGVPRSLLRRRHRRTARCHVGGWPCHGRLAPGGRGVFHFPQSGLRSGPDGCGPAPVRSHLRARQGWHYRTGWGQSSRYVGHVDLAGGAGPAAGGAARRRALPRGAGPISGDRRRPERAPLPQGPGAAGSASCRPARRHGHPAQDRAAAGARRRSGPACRDGCRRGGAAIGPGDRRDGR